MDWQKHPCVLSIAGSDSSAGAGIQADLKTCFALGAVGTSVVSVVTAQNSRGVQVAWAVEPDMIEAQYRAVWEEFPVAAVKIGMLANKTAVQVVSDLLYRYPVPFVVLDTVLSASAGGFCAGSEVAQSLRDVLFPVANVITPNLPEWRNIMNLADTVADEVLHQTVADMAYHYQNAIVLKGGHAEHHADDWLFETNGTRTLFHAKRIESANTHGTGCTFSTALAVGLARGLDLRAAVQFAKDYTAFAIRGARCWDKTSKAHGLAHGGEDWGLDRFASHQF